MSCDVAENGSDSGKVTSDDIKAVNITPPYAPERQKTIPPSQIFEKTVLPLNSGRRSEKREGLSACALALAFSQVAFAQANRLGRDFDQLVVLNKLDAVFQRAFDRRRDLDRILLAADAEVC
jgi:hypothetical protein